ncbi:MULTISPECIES: chitooligosaccharide deacetylase NodB [unclassified Mesorhizobium]|uniref:chitooligosaccharide deacetylase NodB n=1 Tax=unclassified Mesorhizobium TaxID=325217 RepID=UPI000F74C17C|nr:MULTISPECIES: chitooligosaccharide deacetylase NodB [unclassified Mesorhizobium]RUU67055.1 chitooligosaccharide deacetylase NodB [Mesorhizobium sp. M7A.T.Ca.TU.009.01.1.1]RUU88111.1 chitooligosaccharide deacetylase NodB [Mesorhizobium sp. M7A.T.Ca.TU.009.01.1.2]RUV47659.1 chitooligosaccharide deacetylase NodB [Mesorhizobium sp. M7A.F.Ca.MR.228.00.0.0]RUX02052.1 chitooligosaccharide deacetylase NodB [Mesorhizobium sp. M8A.F.Ca.ET.059.01.1.1]RVC68654.1 chitooligosaccharide deacetylase NodB [M
MKPLDYICEGQSDNADGTAERSVYLTFDDGPNSFFTPQILNVLAQHQVTATFFVVGAYAADEPELVRRIITDGHGIANHTMTHPDLAKCGSVEVDCQIVEANRVIGMACPQAMVRYFRAPYGIWTEEVIAASAGAALAPVHWSIDPRDWSRPGVDAIVDRVLADIRPGAIVLLHDGCAPDELQPGNQASLRDQTVTALSRLIPELHGRGFVIRSLPQHP